MDYNAARTRAPDGQAVTGFGKRHAQLGRGANPRSARISTLRWGGRRVSTVAWWECSRCEHSPAFSGRNSRRESRLELERTRTIPHIEENNLIVIRRCEDGW